MLKAENQNTKNVPGFSLLEILIAMAFGVLLMELAVFNYFSIKKLFCLQTQVVSSSENIRLAEFILRNAVMHAGFAGCRNISQLYLINHTTNEFNEFNVIRGYNSANLPKQLLSKNVVLGTDVFVIKKANSDITSLTNDIFSGDNLFWVKRNPAKESNRLLLISDCKNGEIFESYNWQGAAITAKSVFQNSYKTTNTMVSRFEEITFFISKRIDDQLKPIYGLYFLINGGNKQELISEISNLQVLYGVDVGQTGVVGKYLTACEVTKLNLWNKVLSVILTLTPQFLGSKPHKIYIALRERS